MFPPNKILYPLNFRIASIPESRILKGYGRYNTYPIKGQKTVIGAIVEQNVKQYLIY
jgi:hypothetical protein